MKKIIILFISFFLFQNTFGQEIKCKAIVNADQLQGVDKKIFNTLEQAIETFINTRRWTGDTYEEKEKIDVTFSMVLSKTIEGVDGGYTGSLSIQATRPVFNTSYSTPMVNFVDNKLALKYIQFQPLDFNDNRVNGSDALASNLTAMLAYYTYIILGLDYDSYELKGGTPYYNKALNIVNNAPENKNIIGWKPNEGNNRNRYWLTDQFLNNRFMDVRTSIYNYHRNGLDIMTSEPEKGRAAINAIFPLLAKVNQDNPSSILIQFFVNAKGEELMEFMKNAKPSEKQTIIPILGQIDVRNAQKYFELLKD